MLIFRKAFVVKISNVNPLGFFLFLGACASSSNHPYPDDLAGQLQLYDGGDIVTGSVRSAKIVSLNDCLYVEDRDRRYVAFFPTETTVSSEASALMLSGERPLELGRRYSLLLEFYPKLTNQNSNCDGENAYVRSIVN